MYVPTIQESSPEILLAAPKTKHCGGGDNGGKYYQIILWPTNYNHYNADTLYKSSTVLLKSVTPNVFGRVNGL